MTSFSASLKNKYIFPLLVLLVAFYLFSLWGRIPDIDDAWIGELAYWLAEEGQMRSELMRGVTAQEDKFVVNNKLFTLTGALFIKLFGFSVYVLKSVSLLWFAAFLLLFYTYVLKWKKLFNPYDLLFSLVIVFCFTYMFKFSFLFRPEVMMMTMGFAGYIFLERFLNEGKKGDLFLAGILFGLTCAVHLNGLILVASAGVLLLLNRHYLPSMLFGLAIIFGFMPFFFDMTSKADFVLWHHQFFESPALDSITDGPAWLKPFYNLLREYIRYFYKIEIAVYSALMILVLAAGFKWLSRHHRNLLMFALLNILFTGLIAMHKSQQYLLLNFPYVLLLVVITYKAFFEGKIMEVRYGSMLTAKRLLLILLSIFVVVSVYHNALLAFQKFSVEDNRVLAHRYAGDETSRMNIVAPMTFIFNEIENFNRIQGEVCYMELKKDDSTIHGSGMLRKAKTFEIDMLLITPLYAESLGISVFKEGDEAEGFRLTSKTDELLVFKRIQD